MDNALAQDDPDFARMNFTFSGVASIFEYPIPSLGPQTLAIDGAAAHWLDPSTLVWNIDTSQVVDVKLHYSAIADIAVDEASNVSGATTDFVVTELSEAQRALVPHMANWPAFSNTLSAEDVKSMLKGQLIAVAYDAEGAAIAATKVQHARVLDALYTAGDADADEASLGPIYDGETISANVWAPTANSVILHIYDDAKTKVASHAMAEDSDSGICVLLAIAA